MHLPENTNEKAFRFVLDFIYTDKIDPTGDRRELMAANSTVLTMMHVYTLAVTFQMERLVRTYTWQNSPKTRGKWPYRPATTRN